MVALQGADGRGARQFRLMVQEEEQAGAHVVVVVPSFRPVQAGWREVPQQELAVFADAREPVALLEDVAPVAVPRKARHE